MNEEQILVNLTTVFRTVFADDSLIATMEMTSSNVSAWDSLSHVDMIVMVEEIFNVRFSTRDIVNLKNVGDLVQVIQKCVPQ